MKKIRQHNGEKKKYKRTNTIYKTYIWHQRSSSNSRFWLPCKRYIFGVTNWSLHIWLAYKNHKKQKQKTFKHIHLYSGTHVKCKNAIYLLPGLYLSQHV
jgi:hypothetical protein